MTSIQLTFATVPLPNKNLSPSAAVPLLPYASSTRLPRGHMAAMMLGPIGTKPPVLRAETQFFCKSSKASVMTDRFSFCNPGDVGLRYVPSGNGRAVREKSCRIRTTTAQLPLPSWSRRKRQIILDSCLMVKRMMC